MDGNRPNRRELLKSSGAAALGLTGFDQFALNAAEFKLNGFSPISSGNVVRLAGLEWVDGANPGVRLRWSIPILGTDGNIARCLPDKVEIRRGYTTKDDIYFDPKKNSKGSLPTIRMPRRFWQGVIAQVSRFPATFIFRALTAGPPITTSAFYFEYAGAKATMQIENAHGDCISSTLIKNNDIVYVEGNEISKIRILGNNVDVAQLINAKCIYISPKSHFDASLVATLEVRGGYSAQVAFSDIRQRLVGHATRSTVVTTMPDAADQFDDTSWGQMIGFAQEISGSSCSGPPQWVKDSYGGSYRPLDMFATGIAARWEYSVFSGFGFRDGPNPSTATLDTVVNPLNSPPTNDLFYIVTAIYSDGSTTVSDPVFLKSGVAHVLAPPSGCRYVSDDGKASYGTLALASLASPDTAGLKTGGADEIVGSTNVEWMSGDPLAAGIMLSESWGSAVGSARTWLYLTRPYDFPPTGRSPRSKPIALLSKLSGNAATFDGWDRLSKATALDDCSFVPASLQDPPPLGGARYLGTKAGNCVVNRLLDANGNLSPPLNWPDTSPLTIPDWSPNALTNAILSADLKTSLRFFRAVRPPSAIGVVVAGIDSAGLPGVSNLTLGAPLPIGVDYSGGRLRQGSIEKNISASQATGLTVLDGDQATYDLSLSGPCCGSKTIPGTGGTKLLLALGKAVATPDPKNASLWVRLDDNVGGNVSIGQAQIPREFLIQLPDLPAEPDTVSLSWRLETEFPGGEQIHGRLSESVTAQRIPPAPPQPKPFDCFVLGYDYYDRLNVKIVLNEAEESSDSTYQVFWAEAGHLNFESAALPGLIAQQKAHNRELHQVLDIPRPRLVDANYLIGVRAHGAGSVVSPFAVLTLTLLAE